jgi:hypothetical protein
MNGAVCRLPMPPALVMEPLLRLMCDDDDEGDEAELVMSSVLASLFIN